MLSPLVCKVNYSERSLRSVLNSCYGNKKIDANIYLFHPYVNTSLRTRVPLAQSCHFSLWAHNLSFTQILITTNIKDITGFNFNHTHTQTNRGAFHMPLWKTQSFYNHHPHQAALTPRISLTLSLSLSLSVTIIHFSRQVFKTICCGCTELM